MWGACSLHHTDPAIPAHRNARSHKSHLHWHPWTRTLVGSILPVPVFSLLTGAFNTYGLHLTHWQLNNHQSLLHQGVLVRRVVSLPSTSWHWSCLHGASVQPPCASPRHLLFCSSILSFWNVWDPTYQL